MNLLQFSSKLLPVCVFESLKKYICLFIGDHELKGFTIFQLNLNYLPFKHLILIRILHKKTVFPYILLLLDVEHFHKIT